MANLATCEVFENSLSFQMGRAHRNVGSFLFLAEKTRSIMRKEVRDE